MLNDSLVTVAYLVAAVLFILSLGGLSTQETARRGNAYGIAGMLIHSMPTSTRRDSRSAFFSDFVNAYPARPYGRRFASAIASSKVSKLRMAAIGPNGSSLNTFASSGTSARTVGCQKFPASPMRSPRSFS